MGVPKIRASSRAFCNKEPKNVSNSLTVFNGSGGRVYPTVEMVEYVPYCGVAWKWMYRCSKYSVNRREFPTAMV
jgi:hypothetical protein